MIFSGVSSATASMSMPPSVETTKAGPADGAVDQDREIEFAVDVGAVLDVEAVDLLAGGPVCLVTSVLPSISLALAITSIRREGEADAALGVRAEFLELALAAAAGVDLAFHDIERARQRSTAASGGNRHRR
jgi:hypothetical protein